MSTIIFKKLVRDRVPEIIRESGKACCVEQLSEEDYITELYRKLDEETSEFKQSRSTDELADILEVIFAISEARGISVRELEQKRLDKAEVRGAFKKRVFLISVEE